MQLVHQDFQSPDALACRPEGVLSFTIEASNKENQDD